MVQISESDQDSDEDSEPDESSNLLEQTKQQTKRKSKKSSSVKSIPVVIGSRILAAPPSSASAVLPPPPAPPPTSEDSSPESIHDQHPHQSANTSSLLTGEREFPTTSVHPGPPHGPGPGGGGPVSEPSGRRSQSAGGSNRTVVHSHSTEH